MVIFSHIKNYTRKDYRMRKIIVGVCIKKDGKILMVQEALKDAYKMWNFPMGHLDDGETIFEGAKREAKEETGYDVELTSIVSIQNYINKDHIKITFNANIISGDILYNQDEILDVKWIQISELENMNDKELRAYNSSIDIIKDVKQNKQYPLEIVKNLQIGRAHV